MFEALIAALQKLNGDDNILGPEIAALQAQQDKLTAGEATDESALTDLTARVTALEQAGGVTGSFASEADLTALAARVTVIEQADAALDAAIPPAAPPPGGVLTISPTDLPDAVVGVAYAQQLGATGGAGSGFVFAIGNGTLPDGLSLAAGGSITGTPTTAGASTFDITVSDANNDAGSLSYTLNTDVPAPVVDPLTISGNLSVAVVGSPFSGAVTVTGGAPPLTVTASGLPDGLSVDPGGNITGTPTTAGTNDPVFTVTDSSTPTPNTATVSIELDVDAAA